MQGKGIASALAALTLAQGLAAPCAGREPSREEVAEAIQRVEGFDNFLILREIHNPRSVELGRALFSDPRLSHGRVMSCSTCHKPEYGFGDGLARARGRGGKPLQRNSMPLKNTSLDPHYITGLFRDGRAPTLEAAARDVFHAPLEFDTTEQAMADELSRDPGYAKRFEEVFGPGGATMDNAAVALRSYIETLPPTTFSPFDRVLEDPSAMTASQKRGLVLFAGKARCIVCHYSPDLTGAEIINIGEKPSPDVADEGRAAVTRKPSDRRAFKVPSLRNVAVTGPYRHDGSVATLAEVIDFYDRGGDVHEGQDPRIRPLGLTPRQKKDLEAFLHSLTHPPEPGDPPYANPAKPPVETEDGPDDPEPSPYWKIAFQAGYDIDRAQRLLDEAELAGSPWTKRPRYSGKRCAEELTPEAVADDASAGRFSAEEKAFLSRAVHWDLIDYFRSLGFAKGDESLCARLGYEGSKFAAESGYYQCRNWYLEMGFARAMFTKPKDFMKVCRDLGDIDADAHRYQPLCPTIHENLDDTDKMCEKLTAPFLVPTSVRSCKYLFAPINGSPMDCSLYYRNLPGIERCRDYSSFSRAWRSQDVSKCAGSEGCEVLMGRGQAVAARAATRIKAKLCADFPGRRAFIDGSRAEAGALLDEAQKLIESGAVSKPGFDPPPAEAAERLAQIAGLRRRTASR